MIGKEWGEATQHTGGVGGSMRVPEQEQWGTYPPTQSILSAGET